MRTTAIWAAVFPTSATLHAVSLHGIMLTEQLCSAASPTWHWDASLCLFLASLACRAAVVSSSLSTSMSRSSCKPAQQVQRSSKTNMHVS